MDAEGTLDAGGRRSKERGRDGQGTKTLSSLYFLIITIVHSSNIIACRISLLVVSSCLC
jgi:hypothetical protein